MVAIPSTSRAATRLAHSPNIVHRRHRHLRNRLVEVMTKNGSNVETQDVKYVYNAFDQRIAMVLDGDGNGTVDSTESYYYDGTGTGNINVPGGANVASGSGNLILTLTGSGHTVLRRYLMGDQPNQVFAEETVGGSNTTRWALTDHEGSVRDILDNTGHLLDHVVYSVYGEIVSQSDAGQSMKPMFDGMIYDVATGLYYDNHRYLDADQHVFISVDPMSYAAGQTNLYEIGGNDLMDNTDTSGLGRYDYPDNTGYTNGKVVGSNFVLNNGVVNNQGKIQSEVPLMSVPNPATGQQEKVPDFSDFSKGDVNIYLTGDSKTDIKEATKAFEAKYGYDPELVDNQLTFHHDLIDLHMIQDADGNFIGARGRMQLVPKALNNSRQGGVFHVGSASVVEDCLGKLAEDPKYQQIVKDINEMERSGAAAGGGEGEIPPFSDYIVNAISKDAQLSGKAIPPDLGKLGSAIAVAGGALKVVGAAGQTVGAAAPGVQLMTSALDPSNPIGFYYQSILLAQAQLQAGMVIQPPSMPGGVGTQLDAMFAGTGSLLMQQMWLENRDDVLFNYDALVKTSMAPAIQRNTQVAQRIKDLLNQAAHDPGFCSTCAKTLENYFSNIVGSFENGYQNYLKSIQEANDEIAREAADAARAQAEAARLAQYQQNNGIWGQFGNGPRVFSPIADVRGSDPPTWTPNGSTGYWIPTGSATNLGVYQPQNQDWLFVYDP